MNKAEFFQDISQLYNSPQIKGLIQAISSFEPVFGVVDAAMNSYLSNLQQCRFRIIFDKLNNSNFILSDEDIKDNDFLYAYFSTVNYVLRARTDEKAERFAQILKGVYSRDITVDDFESYTYILDQLTDREFTILKIKLEFEKEYCGDESENFEMLKSKHWGLFMDRICSNLNISFEEANILLEIVSLKGCFEIALTYGGNSQKFGDTTPIFQRLCVALESK
jgi:hypothetical protein